MEEPEKAAANKWIIMRACSQICICCQLPSSGYFTVGKIYTFKYIIDAQQVMDEEEKWVTLCDQAFDSCFEDITEVTTSFCPMSFDRTIYHIYLILDEDSKAPVPSPSFLTQTTTSEPPPVYPQRYAYTQTADCCCRPFPYYGILLLPKRADAWYPATGSRSYFHRYEYSAPSSPENADPAAHRNTACPHPAASRRCQRASARILTRHGSMTECRVCSPLYRL